MSDTTIPAKPAPKTGKPTPKPAGTKSAAEKNAELKEKLQTAGKKAEKVKVERHERQVKGAHLLPKLLEAAKAAGCVTDEKSGFIKITGVAKSRAVYLARKGGRCDVSGFELAGQAGVIQISEEQAKAKHLGKVRGMIDFENAADDVVEAAFSAALVKLAEATPEAEKPAKAPKAKKAAAEAPAEGAEAAPAQADGQAMEAATTTSETSALVSETPAA